MEGFQVPKAHRYVKPNRCPSAVLQALIEFNSVAVVTTGNLTSRPRVTFFPGSHRHLHHIPCLGSPVITNGYVTWAEAYKATFTTQARFTSGSLCATSLNYNKRSELSLGVKVHRL